MTQPYPSGNPYPLLQRLYADVHGVEVHSSNYRIDAADALWQITQYQTDIQNLQAQTATLTETVNSHWNQVLQLRQQLAEAENKIETLMFYNHELQFSEAMADLAIRQLKKTSLEQGDSPDTYRKTLAKIQSTLYRHVVGGRSDIDMVILQGTVDALAKEILKSVVIPDENHATALDPSSTHNNQGGE